MFTGVPFLEMCVYLLVFCFHPTGVYSGRFYSVGTGVYVLVFCSLNVGVLTGVQFLEDVYAQGRFIP